jgi:hypothetical protein
MSKKERRFSFRQAVELFVFYQRKLADCNQAIAMSLYKIEGPDDLDELPPQKSKARRKNKSLPFDITHVPDNKSITI